MQVNGKVRGRVRVATGADDIAHEAAARADERIAALLDGATVRKVVVVPGPARELRHRLDRLVRQSPFQPPAPLVGSLSSGSAPPSSLRTSSGGLTARRARR